MSSKIDIDFPCNLSEFAVATVATVDKATGCYVEMTVRELHRIFHADPIIATKSRRIDDESDSQGR